MKRLVIALFLASVSAAALSVAPAEAVTMRRCPDGTMVPDSQRCPTKKIRAPNPGRSGHALPTAVPDIFLADHSPNHAPKPKDSSKKTRDYILGNPKPPIQPK